MHKEHTIQQTNGQTDFLLYWSIEGHKADHGQGEREGKEPQIDFRLAMKTIMNQ